MSSNVRGDNEHWSQWWAQGHITSFGTALKDNYAGATRDHWRQQFDSLPDTANILDIATGNGALATLAMEYAEDNGKAFTVTASDLAEIGTQTTATDARINDWREQIAFYGGTPCEKQPFPDQSFDCILSQYGFEYSDVDATLVEIFRLLRPGGRFLAIAHHAGSAVIARQRVSERVYLAALEQLKLFRLLDRHLASWGKAKGARAIDRLATKPKFQKTGSELEQGLRQFTQAFPNDETAAKVFCAIDDLRRDALELGPARRELAVKRERASFEGALNRLRDLFHAALDKKAVDLFASRAREVGYTEVSSEPFFAESGGLAGWSIALTR